MLNHMFRNTSAALKLSQLHIQLTWKNVFDNHCFDPFLLIRPYWISSWIPQLERIKEANKKKGKKKVKKANLVIKVKIIISYIFLVLS